MPERLKYPKIFRQSYGNLRRRLFENNHPIFTSEWSQPPHSSANVEDDEMKVL